MELTEALKLYGILTPIKKHDVVIWEGEKSNKFYLVLEGSFSMYVNAYKDEPIKIGNLYTSSFFGEFSKDTSSGCSVSVIAEEDSVCLFYNEESFVELLSANTQAAHFICEDLENRSMVVKSNFGITKKSAIDKITVQDKNFIIQNIGKDACDRVLFYVDNIRKLYVSTERFISGIDDKFTYSSEESWAEIPANLSCGNRVAPEVYKQYLFDREVKCPVCGKRFKAKTPLFSKLQSSGFDYDSRQRYNNFNILWYQIVVCTGCNYANNYNRFSTIPPGVAEKILDPDFQASVPRFKGFTEDRTVLQVLESFYTALEISKVISSDELMAARLYMQLYWFYGDLGEKTLARKCALSSRHKYEMALLKNFKLTDNDCVLIYVVVAELSHYLGELDAARRSYQKVIKLGRQVNEKMYNQAADRMLDFRKEAEQLAKKQNEQLIENNAATNE